MARKVVVFSLTFVAACTTTGELKQLTASALERAKIACRAPNVRLGTGYHVSIVVRGPPEDDQVRLEISCIRDQLRNRYWYDQVVYERNPAS